MTTGRYDAHKDKLSYSSTCIISVQRLKEPDPHIDAEDALSSLGTIFVVLIPLLNTVFPTSLSANM